MLSELRRTLDQVEDIRCASCGRPLLKKDSRCTVCGNQEAPAPKAHKADKNHSDHHQYDDQSTDSTGTSRYATAHAEPTWKSFGASQALGATLLMTGILGVLGALMFAVQLDLFKGLMLFGLSLLLFCGRLVLNRLEAVLSLPASGALLPAVTSVEPSVPVIHGDSPSA